MLRARAMTRQVWHTWDTGDGTRGMRQGTLDRKQGTGDRGQGKGNRGGWSSCYQQFIHFLPHTLRCTTKEALQHPYSGTGTNTRQLMRLIAVSKRFNPSPICGLSCQNLSHTIPRYFHPECVCSSLGLAYQGIPLGVQRGKSPK